MLRFIFYHLIQLLSFNQWILEYLCPLKSIIAIIIFGNFDYFNFDYFINLIYIFFYYFRWMLEQVEAGQFIQDLKMNVLQAIQYIIQGWNEVTSDTIKNCWNHTKLLSDAIPRYLYEDDDLMIDDELNEAIKALHLPNMMQVKELLTIPEEDIIYEIPDFSEFA